MTDETLTTAIFGSESHYLVTYTANNSTYFSGIKNKKKKKTQSVFIIKFSKMEMSTVLL